MPGVTYPIYCRTPKMGFSANLTASNTTKDLSSGALYPPIFSSNTINGSFLDHIRMKPLGTNVTTVIRFFMNNGGVTTQANNNSMFAECTLPPVTVNEEGAQQDYTLIVKHALPPGYNVYATLGTAVAAGWRCASVGGDY